MDTFLGTQIVIEMNKSTNQNSKIKRLPYTRMLKSEMADYTDSIVSIVGNYNLESAIINPLYSLLKEKETTIALLRLNYGVDTERLRINNLKGQLMLIISSFKLNFKLFKLKNLELDMHVVENAINSHLCYLNRCRNDKQLNQKIAGFIDLMDSNNEFAIAVNEFDLLNDINEIKRAHDVFNEMSEQRVKLLAKRPKISTKEIIKELFDVIDNLFKGIEVAQVINSIPTAEVVNQEDLTSLVDELRQLSDMYYKSFSLRKANNKRKFEKKQQNNSELNKNETNDTENVVEVDTIPDLETKATSSNLIYKHNPLQVSEALIKKLDGPLGESSPIKLNGDLADKATISSKRTLLLEIGRPCSS